MNKYDSSVLAVWNMKYSGCWWMLQIYFWFSLLHITHGWRVVFKVAHGESVYPGTSLYDLWQSPSVVEDKQRAIQETYRSPNFPAYKSAIVNDWKSYNIDQVKIGLYKDSKEVVAIVFNNSQEDDKFTWFDKQKIQTANQRYTDLTNETVQNCIMNASDGRSFQIVSDNSTECGEMAGWLVVVDSDSAGLCHWDYGLTKPPLFRYSQNTTNVKFMESDTAEVFVIFVDDCAVNPCQHGGVCTLNVNGSSICECGNQQFGSKCELACPCTYGTCHRVKPVNGSINNDTFMFAGELIACTCYEGYTGIDCNKKANCKKNTCKNGGICQESFGSNDFTCDCEVGYYGKTCEERASVDEDSSVGASVAIGVSIPLTVILIGVIVAYCIYIKRNPDGYGRATTYKHMALARDFVRRSIRRLSGKKSGSNKDNQGETTKDNKRIIPKDPAVGMSHVNLGFREGDYDVPGQSPVAQDGDCIDLSPSDGAVVYGNQQKFRYPNVTSAPQYVFTPPKDLNSKVRSDIDHKQMSSRFSDSNSLSSSQSGSLRWDMPPINPRYSDPEEPQSASDRYTPDNSPRYNTPGNISPRYDEIPQNKPTPKDKHRNDVPQLQHKSQSNPQKLENSHNLPEQFYRGHDTDSGPHKEKPPDSNPEYESQTPSVKDSALNKNKSSDHSKQSEFSSADPVREVSV